MVSYNSLFDRAVALFDEGKLDEAENILRELDSAVLDNPFILNLLGLIAQARDLHEQACSYFAAAIRQDDKKAEYYYNLAFSLQHGGKYVAALQAYERVFGLRAEIKEAYNEIACIYETIGQKDEACNWWNKALKIAPDYAIAAINLAKSQNDYEKLLDLSVKYPQETLVWYDLAQIEYSQKQLESAQIHIENALKLQADDADNNYLAGLIYESLGNWQQAFKYFVCAEEFDNKHYGAKLKLANTYSSQNDFIKAEKYYKRLIEMNKNNFDVHNNYAEMLYRQKRTAEALEEYRAAILINPKSADVLNNLGAILKDIGDYEEALGLFFTALTYSPNMEALLINITETLVLLARKNKEQALKIAANWLKSYPDNLYAKQINHALKGEKVANNNEYTEILFDAFAGNYELVMQNLDYSAPLAIKPFAKSMQGRIADLGCGSGLAGQVVKTLQNQIIGVDLSANMLALAKMKNIYDELVKSDIIEFLQKRRDFDWIMAIDVVNYIGDLSGFIKLCAGKKVIFTIETNNSVMDYQLDISSRFQHNPDYVKKLLEKNGFSDIKTQQLVIRKEDILPVDATLFVAQ